MANGESRTSTPVLSPPQVAKPRARIRHSHWALTLLGILAALVICYFGELVFVILLVAVLLAFILAPIVDLLTYIRLPRSLAAAIAIILLLAALGGLVYYSYNQAATLVVELPKYTGRVRDEVARFRKQAENFQVLTPQHEKGVLNVHTTTDWTDILSQGVGSVTTAALAASFIPFLVYFMLGWQEHVRSATVMLFPLESRHTAYVTLGLISAMIRSFMIGNLLVGVLIGGISTAVFGFLHLPFFYFVGFISGFLSLVPYLGILLAFVPPVFVGLGHLTSQDALIIFVTVLGLHLIALNYLYPRLLGKRLELNPLAVTMGLLVWGSLWGGMGLILALPIMAAMKIIFDHVESLKPWGAWLGD